MDLLSKNISVVLLIVVLSLFVLPLTTNAAFSLINPDECSGELCVPPGAKYCTICDGLNAVKNGMDYLITLGLVVAVLIITYGAILIIVGGAMPAKIQQGKSAITGAVVGFVLMLLSWTIINQVFFLIVKNDVTGRPWNRIDCPVEKVLGCITGPPAIITSGGGGGACNNNSICDFGENPTSCLSDCPRNICGNRMCEPDAGETRINCQGDCGTPSGNLTDAEARKSLTDAGIRILSSGNCSDQNNPSCTSLEGLSANTIGGLIRANKACKDAGQGNCISVTGGTEVGHESHGPNYPNTVDVSYNNNALQAFQRIGLKINAGFGTGVTCEPPGGGKKSVTCGPGAGVMHIEFPYIR